MAGWDADSPGLRRNLAKVLESARGSAAGRVAPKFEMARAWHGQAMSGLSVPDPAYVGRFRGEPGLVGCEVQIGNLPGRSVLIGRERVDAVPHAPRGDSKHTAQLSAAKHAYGGARQYREAQSSLPASTALRCVSRNAFS